MNKILLVTNEEKIIDDFPKKLVLLRETDELSYCGYEDAPDIVFEDKPDIVIVHEHQDKTKTINLIKYIKTQIKSVLLLTQKYDKDLILDAYEEGIDDYFSVNSDSSEISIRVVNCIKKDNLKKTINKYEKYLKQYNIISDSGFINNEFSREIIEKELSENDFTQGTLLIISPDENGKANYSSAKMIKSIKNSVRYSDIILQSTDTKIFILLKNGWMAAAVTIFEKLKKELSPEISIKAGICEITSNNVLTLEKHAQNALSESLLTGQDFVIYSDENNKQEDNWLTEPKGKNYKLFKNIYSKKLEKVIAPVFYRLQKSWEEKLFDTKIEQYTDETQSVFKLINPKQTSLLKIVYPGFAKIIVYITHEGLDSPENSEMSIPINKIDNKDITNIVENFIREFKDTIE